MLFSETNECSERFLSFCRTFLFSSCRSRHLRTALTFPLFLVLTLGILSDETVSVAL